MCIAVSPSLESFQLQTKDLIPPGTCKLLPSTYAWLHHQTSIAKEKYHEGKIAPSTWETIRSRFNNIHQLAVSAFGQSTLDKVINLFARMPQTEKNKINPFGNDDPLGDDDATAQDSTASPLAGRVERQPDNFSSSSQTTGNQPAIPASQMDMAELKNILENWDSFTTQFISLDAEVTIRTKHCGKITLVQQPTDITAEGRKELSVDGAKNFAMILDTFGPGCEIVKFKDIREKKKRTET